MQGERGKMGEILIMVKRVSVFLLGATVLNRLFMGTEYKKYMEFATGLILIALLAAPFLSVFGKDTSFEVWLSKGIFDSRAEETKEEIRLLGKEYEESVWERYEKQVRQDVAEFCGVSMDKCRVWMEEGDIERIEVRVREEQPADTTLQMSVRYGVDEDCIFFIEEQ